MKAKDYRIQKNTDSRDGLYYAAKKHLEEQTRLIENSEYNLFDENEELSEEKAKDKYFETNNRAFLLSFVCELFLKYILMCQKIQENPNFSIGDLWDRRIRTHSFENLFELIEEKDPELKRIAFEMMAYNRETETALNNGITYVDLDLDINTYNSPRKFLLPPFNSTMFSNEEYIEELNRSYSDTFVKSRYAMQNTTCVELEEIFNLSQDLNFLADLCHEQDDSLDFGGIAYVKAMLKKDKIYKDVLTIRTDEEMQELLNMKIVKDSPSFLYNFLTEKINMSIIRGLVKSSKDEDDMLNKLITLQQKGFDIYVEDDKSSIQRKRNKR